jgi:hypothetical protein
MKSKLLFVLMIVICSCGRSQHNVTSGDGSIIKIDLLSKPESTVKNLSEFAANVEYIPLQTTKNSLIGNFRQKIVLKDTKIYISSLEEILCFDTHGKYLFKLQNKGRGPEEYSYLTDFDVSSDNKFLALLSSPSSKLMIYDISDDGFTFRKSISLKKPIPYKVNVVPGRDILLLSIAPWFGTEPTLSLMINTAGDTIHFKPNCYKYQMDRSEIYQSSNEMIAYPIEGMACFKEEFSDTVFYADAKDKSFKPRMILDSHGLLTTPAIRGGLASFGNNTIYVAYMFETSRYVFCYYGSGELRNGILFDKTTKSKQGLATDNEMNIKVKDDLSVGPDFNINFSNSYCSDGKLFSFAETMHLKQYVLSEEFKAGKANDIKKKDELKKLADSLAETDNPVLIAVTLKN